MSYNQNKATLKRLFLQARSANWLLRAYGRAIVRSLTKRQRGGAARLRALLLSLIFFHFFPFLVTTSYMSWEGFFSYDMFTEGVSGVTAFYWWAEIFLIIGSAYIAGSLYFIVESKVKNGSWLPIRSFLFWIALVVNVLFLWLILTPDKIFEGQFTREHMVCFCLIAAWVMIHVAILFHASAKAALVSLAIGAAGLTTLAMIHPGTLAFPYSLSLQYFGNGGGVPATVKLAKRDVIVQGKLMLASPNHIYLYPDGQKSLVVIARRDVEQLSVKNLAGFGHGKVKEP
jgi:hypothetical protein